MKRTRVFAATIACLSAILCFSCKENTHEYSGTSDATTEATDSGGTTAPGDGADTESDSGTTIHELTSGHISGGGTVQSSNYSAKLSVGGSAAGKTSSANYSITFGAGAIVYKK